MAAGDIEFRGGQQLTGAIEVTAGAWAAKVGQLTTAAVAGLAEVTIAASGVATGVSGGDLGRVLAPEAERLGLDVAVVDLHAYMDVVASRIGRYARADAFSFVHRCLARWHRRQPELAHRLIDALTESGLVLQGAAAGGREAAEDVGDLLARVRGLMTDPEVAFDAATPAALRALANELEGRRGRPAGGRGPGSRGR